MRGSSFAGSLVFAALATLGALPWMLATGPIVGSAWALGLYSLTLSVVYVAWIAPSWPRRITAGAVAGGFAAAVALAAPMPAGGVLGAAAILAVARSGFLYTSAPARALVVEAVLTGGGLVVARALAGPSLLSLGLAFWGFFLVQSAFFLIGGISRRTADGPRLDPFDEARRRAMALMEEVP